MIIALICISSVLFVTNIVTLFLFLKKPKQKQLTQDANQLLSDLMRGGAVVITQIAKPEEIFLYSPRDLE